MFNTENVNFPINILQLNISTNGINIRCKRKLGQTFFTVKYNILSKCLRFNKSSKENNKIVQIHLDVQETTVSLILILLTVIYVSL